MNDSPQRNEATLPMAEILGETEQPAELVDFDAIGEKYLMAARLKTAIDRWHAYCPEKLKTTNWQDAKLAPYSKRHDEILGWEYQDRGILAAGPTGRGKSRAMWALMKRLSEERRECRFFTAASWFSTLQSQVSFGRETAHEWVQAIAKVPIVFIDDLGNEALQTNKQEWCIGWLFQFLDLRLGNGLPLFLTTNLGAKEMAEQAQETRANPLVRRLADLCQIVRF